ncbi:hypothetical protein ILYODFUR_031823 [Ilyodon furcidens]|uniref:Uncharacterized protein n=1 Tax=Ilyodon furcidens TaxID=33524 RepID=A0ABV0TDV1_9TELE
MDATSTEPWMDLEQRGDTEPPRYLGRCTRNPTARKDKNVAVFRIFCEKMKERKSVRSLKQSHVRVRKLHQSVPKARDALNKFFSGIGSVLFPALVSSVQWEQ